MKAIDPGHVYELDDGTRIVFRREAGGPGATTCEILDLLQHRLEALDKKHSCTENLQSIQYLYYARCWQQKRAKRIADENAKVHSCAPTQNPVSARLCTPDGKDLRA